MHEAHEPRRCPIRRRFLQVGVGSLTAGVAGCTGNGSSNDTTTDIPTETPTDTVTENSTESSTKTPGAPPSPDDWSTYRGTPAKTSSVPGSEGPTAPAVARWRFDAGTFVSSSPVIVDGVVYVSAADGNVYTLDADSGEKRWAFRPEGDITADCTPAVADGTVYVGANRWLYALEAR
ncbi:outer membrane protein assembly factor BamB family protein [Haladaptatus sp. NG-SE-30]